jgi:hypothetical protein
MAYAMRHIRKPDGINYIDGGRRDFIGSDIFMGNVIDIGDGFGLADREEYQGGFWLTHFSSGAVICAVRDTVDARQTVKFLVEALPGTPIDWTMRAREINVALTMKLISWGWDFNVWKGDKEIWLLGQVLAT